MLQSFEIVIKVDKTNHIFKIRQPSTDEERELMHKYRYEIYHKYNYIVPNPLKQDIDDHDKHSAHIVATYDDNIIGTFRLIFGNTIPTRDLYYKYQNDKIFENETIFEIGRIISTSYRANASLPRHFVLLTMLYYVLLVAQENSLTMAVGAMKERLAMKLLNVRVPIMLINNFELNYDPKQHDDPLIKFFDEKLSGRICPITIRAKHAAEYFHGIYNNSFVFDIIDQHHLVLKNIYRFNLVLLYKKHLGKKIENYK